MHDLIVSVIRTWVPILMGSIFTYAATAGIEIDDVTRVNLIAGLTGLVSALYYFVARLLENKWPAFGLLLGIRKTPKY